MGVRLVRVPPLNILIVAIKFIKNYSYYSEITIIEIKKKTNMRFETWITKETIYTIYKQ